MAYRVEVTARAERDLHRIYRQINAQETEQARLWFNGMEEAVTSLAEFPARCPVTPEDSTLRHLLYGNKPHVYRIVFEIDEQGATVLVISVRHGAQEPFTLARKAD